MQNRNQKDKQGRTGSDGQWVGGLRGSGENRLYLPTWCLWEEPQNGRRRPLHNTPSAASLSRFGLGHVR